MNKENNFYHKSNRLQQLRGFYYAAMHNSISKAAEVMSLNQSTVTTQIKALEASLDVELFDRHSPVIRINNQGEILFDLVEHHILGLDKIYKNFNVQKQRQQDTQISIASQHMGVSF